MNQPVFHVKYPKKQYLWISGVSGLFLLTWMVFANFLPPGQALARSAFAFLFFGSLIFVNLAWLIPYFLQRKKFALYLLLVLIVCLVLSLIRYFIESHLSIDLSMIMRNVTLSSQRKIFILFFNHALVASMSLTYYFARQWLETDKREALMKTERLEAEINFLKAQVNPHFLFNTLHNLYAMSYLKDERTPALLLKLADIMRYLIYEGNQPLVPLTHELSMIDNYIELQKVKNNGFERITMEHHGIDESIQIPPLLIVPFVENMFKHSDIETNVMGRGTIKIEVEPGKGLTLQTNNSMKSKSMSKESGGFGLTNVTRRLQLLFLGKYKLDIKEKDSEFSVHLFIPFS